MPAVVNRTVGSFSGITEALGITAWPLLLKKLSHMLRNSPEVIFFMVVSLLYFR